MIRIGICEDVPEELHRQARMVQGVMAKLSKNSKLFAFQSGEDLLFEMDVSGNMDIVFLDIEMQGIDGIKTAEAIRQKDTRAVLVFVSAHEQYFKAMIDVHPFAFISKPVSEKRVGEVLEKILSTEVTLDDCYSFSYHKKQYRIPLAEIRYFQSDKRMIYVDTIHESILTDGYQFYGKLEDVEEAIGGMNIKFIRVRKSFLVNSQYIMEYAADKVVMDNRLIVEISKNYKENVRSHYISALKGKMWG